MHIEKSLLAQTSRIFVFDAICGIRAAGSGEAASASRVRICSGTNPTLPLPIQAWPRRACGTTSAGRFHNSRSFRSVPRHRRRTARSRRAHRARFEACRAGRTRPSACLIGTKHAEGSPAPPPDIRRARGRLFPWSHPPVREKQTMTKYKLEYIWLDGYTPVPNLRGKTQIKDFRRVPDARAAAALGLRRLAPPCRPRATAPTAC